MLGRAHALSPKFFAISLLNVILIFGRNNDRNVQCIVNGRFGDGVWTYLCISSKVLNRIGCKNIIKELFRHFI